MRTTKNPLGGGLRFNGRLGRAWRAEADGVNLTFQDDRDVQIEWERPTDEDRVLETGEIETVEEEASL